MKLQQIRVCKFLTFGTAKCGKSGGEEIGLGFSPLFPTCCWTVIKFSQNRKAWLCTRPVTGAARNGLGRGEKKNVTPLPQKLSMVSTFPGLLPEQAQDRLCIKTTLPNPNPSVQCKSTHNFLVEWQSKETVKHEQFCKAKKHFSWS